MRQPVDSWLKKNSRPGGGGTGIAYLGSMGTGCGIVSYTARRAKELIESASERVSDVYTLGSGSSRLDSIDAGSQVDPI